ncbi:uncharacterized protein [Littorina saxatilis]|uniref:Chromo domain-containing protein n=1 Tax=Littorina saxatilis TaxID=31220 RepID=A0AAN9ALC8_9CAEN
MKRSRMPNQRYAGKEWILDGNLGKVEKVKQKEWEIEDILDRRGAAGGAGEEVLCKWKGKEWVGHNSWVSLKENPGLASYLEVNKSNPLSSTFAKHQHSLAQERVPNPHDSDLQYLRQEVWEELGEPQPTPDGNIGFRLRVRVSVPFKAESFDQHFRHLPGIPPTGNVRGAYFHIKEITPILGEDVCRRPAPRTSSEMRINPHFKIHLAWGYKTMVRYDHSECPCCSYVGPEDKRPHECCVSEVYLPSQPKLTLSFSRMMVNTLACS